MEINTRRLSLILLFLWLPIYAAILIYNTCYVASFTDTSGYLNSARDLGRGRIVNDVPDFGELGVGDDWRMVFVPLGYVPGPRPRTMVASYPPGLPLHMVVAAKVGGWNYAPYLVSPLSAMCAALLMFFLAREFNVSPAGALAAVIIFSVFPTVVVQATLPMSDVLVTCWSILAMLAAMRSRKNAKWAIVAGAAFAVAVLVKSADVLLIVTLQLLLPFRFRQIGYLILGALPFAAIQLSYNSIAFGGFMTSGYGSISDNIRDGELALSFFPTRAMFYLGQLFSQWSPLVVVAWLGVFFVRAVPMRNRIALFSLAATFYLFYCCYKHYQVWWYVRYLLPALPAFIIGALLTCEHLTEKLKAWKIPGAYLLKLGFVLTIIGVELMQCASYDVLYRRDWENNYLVAANEVVQRIPKNSRVVCMQMSGALHYYTDLRIIRWDTIDDAQLDSVKKQTRDRGERLYALLFPFEVEQSATKLGDHWSKIADYGPVSLWLRDPAAP